MDLLCTCRRCWGRASVNGSPCPTCAGSGKVPDPFLSDFFRYSEVTGTALRSIANDPDDLTLERMRRHLRDLVDPLRVGLGVPLYCTSGYRSPGPRGLDFAVSGPPFDVRPSAHSDGTATDLYPGSPRTILDAVRWILAHESALAWDQVIVEGGCVHVASAAPRTYGEWVQRRHVLVRVRSAEWDAWERTRVGVEPARYGYETYRDDDDRQRSRTV